MNTLALLGGMITRPLSTLRSIAAASSLREGAPLWPPLALLLVITTFIQAKILTRLLFLLDEGGATIAKRIREAIVDDLKTDAAVLAGTLVLLVLLARVLSKGRVKPSPALAAGVWLLVPLIVLKCIGGALQAAGVDLWFLPHEAVDSPVVIVDRHVSWLRFVVKCAVGYGPSLALATALVWSWRRDGSSDGGSADDAAASELAVPAALHARAVRARVGLAVVVVAVASLAITSTISAVMAGDRLRPLQAGDALPEAAFRLLDGEGVSKKKKIKLSSFQGKVLVLDFWASWCTPCRRSMPELSALHEELGPRGLVVLGVNREPSDPAAAAAALKQIAPKFDSVIDERFYGDRIGLTTLPTSYLVDRKGVVRQLHLGYTEPALVRAEIEALLSE